MWASCTQAVFGVPDTWGGPLSVWMTRKDDPRPCGQGESGTWKITRLLILGFQDWVVFHFLAVLCMNAPPSEILFTCILVARDWMLHPCEPRQLVKSSTSSWSSCTCRVPSKGTRRRQIINCTADWLPVFARFCRDQGPVNFYKQSRQYPIPPGPSEVRQLRWARDLRFFAPEGRKDKSRWWHLS
jgi:hypothetical protein